MSTGKKKALLVALCASVLVMVGYAVRYSLRAYEEREHGPEISETQQLKTARHEAGHAIIGLVVNPALVIDEIVVQARLHPSGRFGHTQPHPDPKCETAREIFDDVTDTLGGRAADSVLNGAPDNGAGSDLAYANREFCAMCTTSGLCGSLLVKSGCDDADTKKVVEKCLNAANARAEAIANANRDQLEALARLIMAQPVEGYRRRISKEQLKTFIAEHPLVPEQKDVTYECP